MSASARGDPIRVEREGAVATLSLDRPDALNALDFTMMDALPRALASVAADDAIRVLVITGTGRHFMAGGDLRAFASALEHERAGGEPVDFRRRLARLHAAIETLHRMPQVVVAKVRGAAAGFGLSLVCACDLAIASDSAYFSAAYRSIGLSPDGGGTYSLPRLVGTRRALEILLLSPRFDAAQAAAWGIVNRVVDDAALDGAVSDVVAALAAGPRDALARTKRLVRDALERPLSAQLDAEAAAFAACAVEPDFSEGLAAFLGKRAPTFR